MFGLVSGLRFVLDKIASAADAELDDQTVLRDRLLRAQVDLEEGRSTEAAFRSVEREIFERLRALKAERGPMEGSWRVESVEVDAGPAPLASKPGRAR